MWLGYEGLGRHRLEAIERPVLVLAGDRAEFVPVDLPVALHRALPSAELAVCRYLSHDGPSPEGAPILASLIADVARRNAER
jgi:pimeloyl-ACP methyl ester carboxylesterase